MRSGDQGPRGTAPAPRSCFSFRGSQQPRPCTEASARAVPCPQDAAPRVPAPTPAGPSSAAAASVRAFPARPSIPGGGCPSRQGRPTLPGCSVAPTKGCHCALSLRRTPGARPPCLSLPVVCPVNRCEHSGPHLTDEATRSAESLSHVSAVTQLPSAVRRPAERGRKLATESASRRLTPGAQQLCPPCSLARGWQILETREFERCG